MQFGKNGAVKVFHYGKDGGSESRVWGFWLVGIKKWFSIILLRFENGSREAYHSHAFNCVSFIFKGRLEEHHLMGGFNVYMSGFRPIITRRDTFHKVYSLGRTWVLTFRGPWTNKWQEAIPRNSAGPSGAYVLHTLTHGRLVVR